MKPRLTIRCAVDDLKLDAWNDEGPVNGFVDQVDHPIVKKTAELFPDDRDLTEAPETISTVSPACYKIKVQDYRGAAYRDSDGQVWIVAAGRRRGRERSDFYQVFLNDHRSQGKTFWLPSDRDLTLLDLDKNELVLRQWEKDLWTEVDMALGNEPYKNQRIEVYSPFPKERQSPISIIDVNLIDIEGEILGVEVRETTLDWSEQDPYSRLALYAVMCRINHSEQSWSLTPAAINDPSATLAIIEFDEKFNVDDMQAGTFSSKPPVNFNAGAYTHSVADHSPSHTLMECIVEGNPVLALCGQVFVPRQDHHGRDKCTHCESIKRVLARAHKERN